MPLRKFQFVWVLLIAGLAACGGEVEDDGRVAIPLQIAFTDPSANSAEFDLTYELMSPEGFLISEGQLASNLIVLNGVPEVIDSAFFAKPGDSLTVSMVASIEDASVSSDLFIHVFGEADVALQLGVNYLEQEDAYILSLKPYVP